MNFFFYLFPVFLPLNNTDNYMNKTMVMEHLRDYGYLSDMNATDNEMKTALQDYQYYIGADATGEMDNETMDMMLRPRCGKPDQEISHDRIKRFTFLGNKTWSKSELFYKFENYPTTVNQNDVHDAFDRAFRTWSQHIKITFKHAANVSGDINIRFRTLDGRGRSIGYALNPTKGTVILDKDEYWTMEGEGINVYQIALHEIGHSLGLGHSSKRLAVMYPYYMGYNKDFALDMDDIKGIKALYRRYEGGNHNQGGDNTYLCNDPKIDTIFTAPDNCVYVLKDDKYWKFTSSFVMMEGPKLIKSRWSDLPNNIDAAFTSWNNVTFFYKGDQLWKYILDKKHGKPNFISVGFDNIPGNLDAAFIWGGSGQLYFFKGDKYWMMDFFKPPGRRIKYIFPLPIAYWYGIPNNIDDAVSIEGATYFFKGTRYYKYDDMNRRVYDGYPRNTAKNLFGCS